MAIKKSKARRRSVHTENPRQIVFQPPIFRKRTRSSGLYRSAPMDEEVLIVDLSEGSVTDSVSPSVGTPKHQQENEHIPTLLTLAAVETNKNHGVPIAPNTEGKPINVGKIICGSIKSCADRHHGNLFYPVIIHKLLAEAHVVKLSTDTICTKKMGMNRQNIQRLFKCCRIESVGSWQEIKECICEQARSVRKSLKRKFEKVNSRILAVEDSLGAVREERKRWLAYEEHKDRVWREELRIMNPRALNGFPPFPFMHTSATPTHFE